MAQITKTVNKTLVNGSEIFIYTINAAFSDLTQPAQDGKIIDFFPTKIKYILPPIGGQILSITETAKPGGTEVSFNLGSVNSGTSLSFTIACSFGPGRVDNDSYTNKADLVADGVSVAQATAPTVFLQLDESFILTKFAQPSNIVNPGDEVTFILSLSNNNDPGASITNVVVTDTLPPELTPVTSFTPVGNDVPTGGYADPTANGLTGSWSGNTLTFNLPKYNGARYDITFKAKVSATVTPGQTFVNTGKWTMNSTQRNDAPLTLSVFDPSAAGFGLYKAGTRTTVIGGPIDYELNNNNTGNVPLSNYVLEDLLPSEVDITSFRLNASTGLINYSIYIALASNPTTYIPIVENVPSGPYPFTPLTPFIPTGDRIAKIKLTAQNLNVTNSGHALILSGVTNNTAIFGTRFTNTAIATSGNISKTALWATDVNGASDLQVSKSFNPSLPAYYPLEEFAVTIRGAAINTITVEPILVDLMPTGLRYVLNSEYFVYYEPSTGKSYDSRQPGFPIPLPVRDIIPNFAGTGQVLLRWSFFDFILPTAGAIDVVFKAFVEINPPSSFLNKAYEGMPGNAALFVYNEVKDPLDVDADGLTDTDRLSYTEVGGVILTTSEFSLKKMVKGEKDLDFSSSGVTVQGGNIDYRLQVTNNQPMDLKNIEIVDILPYVGDTGVILTNQQRGSQFDVYATSIVTAKIVNVIGDPVDPNPDIIIEYSISNDPKRFDQLGNPIGTGDWSLIPPQDITTLRSIKVTTGPSVTLRPYDRLIIDFGANAPVGAPIGKIAYNSYAVRANKIINGVVEPLLPTEPNKVAVTIAGNILGTIGDFVWEDLNGNGIYDQGEPGVNGVTVKLYSDSGILLGSTVTTNDANGNPGYYLFTGLVDGVYQVKFIPYGDYSLTQQQSGQPNGSKPDPLTGFTAYITMSNGQQILDIDAGVIGKNRASIGDFVWNDLNENGIFNQGEPGINGVTVELYSDTGALLKSTVTANDGNGNPGYYIFDNLTAGNYKVKFIPSGNYILTQQKAIEPNGSRPNPTTGFTNTITLAINEKKTDIDAGVIATNMASIGDFVWDDLNGNGIYDQGEPGINGVTVELYSDTGALLKSTVTANDGNGNPGYYIFDNLTAGSYKVKFIPSGNYILTQQKAIEPNGSRPNPTTGFTNTITLAINEKKTDVDAGVIKCTPPVINATDKCICVGSQFDPLKDVTATDCQGNDITEDIIVTENTVNTQVVGIYHVTYQVTDSHGLTTTKTIQVKVNEKNPYSQSVTDLIESVALVQTALSHILNAEGEKIQLAAASNWDIDTLIAINKSVENTVVATSALELILQSKLEVIKCQICKGDCCN